MEVFIAGGTNNASRLEGRMDAVEFVWDKLPGITDEQRLWLGERRAELERKFAVGIGGE